MSDKNALERLREFISNEQLNEAGIHVLTPDASTREYFRIDFHGRTAIACVYPEPFVAAEQNYLDVTRVFRAAGIPVAEIYKFDENLGVIVLEDFGNTILRDILIEADAGARESLLNDAIEIIARIQAATPAAFEQNSIASKLKFDVEKLSWELGFFKTHYFESLKKRQLGLELSNRLDAEFTELSSMLENRAEVLCHRDFHAANLMVTSGKLKVIDHQDARIGAAAYDLVSLLLDRVTEVPDRRVLDKQISFFHQKRRENGLPVVEKDEFDYEFDLVSVQRCLKAIGTFSNQTANCGKSNYVQYIRPMFRIVLDACQRLNKFPALQTAVKDELEKP